MTNITLLRNGNAREFISYLRSSKIPFYLKCSNYTTSIKSDLITRKFVKQMQSKRTFAAFQKLKGDVKDKPVPELDMNQLSYFVHNFRRDSHHPEVFNIDLKSAYATILYLDGYISEATYTYLSKVNKQERLASVGMLASKSHTFYFSNTGEPVDAPAPEISPYANFFFYAVKRTADIMDELKAICGNTYLFTWVDGIYFLPDEQVFADCCECLEKIGFKYSVEYLSDFKVVLNDVCTKVLFKKAGKTKLFNLPHANSEFKKTVIESIHLVNHKKSVIKKSTL